MKTKAAKNRKMNRRRKRNAPSKVEALAADNMEQATLDSLDPIKNAKSSSLFLVDKNSLSTRNKMIRNKTTWGERMTTSRGLGVVLPAHNGKTPQEKRKLPDSEKAIIEAKAKRLKGEASGELKGEIKGEDGDVMVDEGEEKKPVNVLIKGESKPKNVIDVESEPDGKPYDLWANAPVRPVKPKQSFIQEVLHPKQRSFTAKPLISRLPAVPLPHDGQSYRPTPESHEILKKDRKEAEAKVSKEAEASHELLVNLRQQKNYFPPIDKNNRKDDDGDEEVNEIRQIPKKHKTAKQRSAKHQRNIAQDLQEREEARKRKQRDIFRIPEILEGIEERERKTEARAARRLVNRALRVKQPFSTDNKKVIQPAITPVLDNSSQRLRTLNAIVNPIKERILSMKNRGLVDPKKARMVTPGLYKFVEPKEIREYIQEDEEKYLQPVLDQERQRKQKQKS